MGIYTRKYRSGRKSYYCVVRYKGLRYVSPAFRSKQLARQEDGRIAGAISDGTWEKIFGPNAVPTFSELANEYLEECGHRNAPSTVRSKGFHVARLKEEFGNRCIDDVASFHVQALKRKLAADRSGATVNRHLSTLSGIFKLALQSGYIDRIPTQGIARYPERTDRWTVISQTEFADLVRACPDAPLPWFDVFLQTLWFTGCRVGELLNAKWDQVDWTWGGGRGGLVLNETKNRERRIVGLPLPLLKLLRAHRRCYKEDVIFPAADGQPVPYDTVYRAWKRVRKAAGLPRRTRLHDIRHSYATTLLQKGASESRVQHLLGHKTPSMTKRYMHLVDVDTVEAVALLDTASVNENVNATVTELPAKKR